MQAPVPDNFMFYAKVQTLLECVKESVLKTIYRRSRRKYVENRAVTKAWVAAAAWSSCSQLHELFAS